MSVSRCRVASTPFFQNTETADLWQAWTEVSGINVADLMERWTKRMGYPYLKVVEEKWSDSALELTLEQAWFLADGSEPTEEEASTAVWKIPLLFATSAEVSDTAVIMEGKRQTLSIPLAGPGDWVKINAGQKALVRVAASPEMTARLQPAIKRCAPARWPTGPLLFHPSAASLLCHLPSLFLHTSTHTRNGHSWAN